MKYNFVTATSPKTVTVITPTIGSPKVLDAILSVKAQTYGYINHLIVVDGPDHQKRFTDNFTYDDDLLNHITLTISPFNTGANGFNGQRIYAAYPHLINSDYVFFLDEDNWYAPDHVESLVKVLEQNDFAYSLRSIYDEEKNFLCEDNCESLGKWPIYFTHDDPQYLVDTSSFAFRKDFIQKTCHLWHSGVWGEDRRYLYAVKDHCKWGTSGKHTLSYRLGGNERSVKEDFFAKGNADQLKHYNNKLPWKG
jgi:glycosyltransferase involved in cell wall biosynthesis